MLRVREVVPAESNGRIYSHFNLDLHRGERVSLVGNGSPKLLACIAGQSDISAGRIELVEPNGVIRIDEMPIERRAVHGLVFVPSTRNVFLGLTVEENLRIAFAAKQLSSDEQHSLLEDAMHFAPVLSKRSKQTAGTLSGGEQKALAITRAILVVRCQKGMYPKLTSFSALLLDQPTLGLDVLARERLAEQLCNLKNAGIAVLIADEEGTFAQRVTERIYDVGEVHATQNGARSAAPEDDKTGDFDAARTTS